MSSTASMHRERRRLRGRRPEARPALVGRAELPHGRPDLPEGERPPARTARDGAHQAEAARPLGHQPRPVDDLRPAQPAHRPYRLRLALRHRPGPRRARTGGRRIPRGHLLRGLPARHRGRRRRAHPFPSVLLARRRAQPRQRPDPRQHPRGRRARVCVGARRRGGDGPPGPLRRLRRGRWGGRDRPAVRVVEAPVLPQPSPGRRGPADPPPQRLQDRRSDGVRPDVGRGRGRVPAQPGLGPGGRRGPRPGAGLP